MESLTKERLDTLSSIKKHTAYKDLNIYSMEVFYEYNLDRLTPSDVHDTQTFMGLVFKEAMPGIAVDYTAPDYGCSAFTFKKRSGGCIMGRNYDFKFDSSAMIVLCHPKNGYASIGHAALDNVQANNPDSSELAKVACLTSPFICLDGINEKGVGIAVLTLDSNPVCQNTGKPVLPTTLLIRLVLDKAASTAEAIDLIKKYDMYAISGRDYHFFITDNTGDCRVVEFDCEKEDRAITVTPSRAVTNFYIKYKDKVLPNQKNGIYGHGRERYDAIEEVLNKSGRTIRKATAWKALRAAAQEPNPESITSNTQWSIAYNLKKLDYEIVLHRNWNDVLHISTLKKYVKRHKNG